MGQTIASPYHKGVGILSRKIFTLRIDTPIEDKYDLRGGILPYVLRLLVNKCGKPETVMFPASRTC